MNISRLCILALSCLLPWVAASQADETPDQVTPLGSFSSINEDAEHCNGEALDVWRIGNTFVGLFHTCAGTSGDTITAVASVRQFDATTHAVVFEGALSRGTDYLKGGVQTPSKDHFSFKGTISGDEIVGSLSWIDENYPTHKPKVATLHLRRKSVQLPGFATQADWSRYATNLSGPRFP